MTAPPHGSQHCMDCRPEPNRPRPHGLPHIERDEQPLAMARHVKTVNSMSVHRVFSTVGKSSFRASVREGRGYATIPRADRCANASRPILAARLAITSARQSRQARSAPLYFRQTARPAPLRRYLLVSGITPFQFSGGVRLCWAMKTVRKSLTRSSAGTRCNRSKACDQRPATRSSSAAFVVGDVLIASRPG